MSEEFNPLQRLVEQSLKKHNLEQKLREKSAVSVWNEVVGPRIAKSTEPERIRDGILFVSCKTATWANELMFLKNDIIKKLNNRLGGRYVKDIRFAAKSHRERTLKRDEVEEGDLIPEKEFEDIRLPPEELEKIEEAASGACDEELAARIRKALTTSRKLGEWKKSHGWKKCSSCGTLFQDGDDVCPLCNK